MHRKHRAHDVFSTDLASRHLWVHYVTDLKLPHRHEKQIWNRYTCSCCDPPPSSLLRYLPHSWRKIGRPIPYCTDYWEPLPTPLPILPFALQQPTATRPRCSWIIQAGRQPIALSFVGEDATTKDRQLADLLWLSSPGQKTMATSVSAEGSRTLKLQAQSHIHNSGPISVLLRQIPELARFLFGCAFRRRCSAHRSAREDLFS